MLVKWSEKCQIEFNPDKYEVMNFATTNETKTYTMNGRALGSIEDQSKLSVQAHQSLKVELRCTRK